MWLRTKVSGRAPTDSDRLGAMAERVSTVGGGSHAWSPDLAAVYDSVVLRKLPWWKQIDRQLSEYIYFAQRCKMQRRAKWLRTMASGGIPSDSD